MKFQSVRFWAFVVLLFLSGDVFSKGKENFIGNWKGEINVQGMKLELIFKINYLKDQDAELQWQTRLDVPAQRVKNFPVDKTEVKKKKIHIELSGLNAEFNGKLVDTQTIKGVFTQRGQSFDLKLTKYYGEAPLRIRTQTPKEPFDYISKDIQFSNSKGSIRFAGTITHPQKTSQNQRFKTVILVSGSGAQDRDETIFDHKPFAVIADYLTRNGYAVLRVDDRGAGNTICAASELNYTTADLVNDVQDFVDYMADTLADKGHIYLMGHSEGSAVIAMLAAKNNSLKNPIHGIIGVGTPLVEGMEIIKFQNEESMKAMKLSDAEVRVYMDLVSQFLLFSKERSQKERSSTSPKIAPLTIQEFDTAYALLVRQWEERNSPATVKRLKKRMNKISKQEFDALNKASFQSVVYNKWIGYFLGLNPYTYWSNELVHRVIINGELDSQVPEMLTSQPAKTLESQNAQNPKNKQFTYLVLPKHNHLMQECVTGSVDEYQQIEQTTSELFLNTLLNQLNSMSADSELH